MRVVLDTNIFISGIHWKGASEKILLAWINNKFELVSSNKILEEIARTLINFKIPLPNEDIKHWINIIASKSLITEPTEKIEIVKDDPDDNKFIEVAVSSGSEYIVTYDNHLLKIKEFRDVKIITPEEFLRIINN